MYNIIEGSYKGLMPTYRVMYNGVEIYFSFNQSEAVSAMNYHRLTGRIH